MGGRFSRREVVPQSVGSRDNPYRYPPPDGGNYFSSHYQFGHRKYENGEPEYFLFGEMNDINFLSNKPVVFPYKQPGKHTPLSCLQCHINVHRDSVRLVKSTENEDKYYMAFEFNSDVDCRISLLSSLPDSAELSSLRHGPGSGVQSSQHYLFPSGSEQSFNGRDFPLTPGEMREEELRYNPEEGQDVFPIAIFMETSSAAQYQSQLTLCALDKSSDGGYTVKVIRQKLWVDGVEYVLQEIYGLENKAKPREEEEERGGSENEGEEEDSDDEGEDLGAECVICITDARDTLLLPCRHLCLCATCAGNLRYQSNNCPICRTPFKALLQVTALKPLDPSQELDDDSVTGNPRYSIPGFEMMTVLEALNGYKLNLNSDDRVERRDKAAQTEEENEDEEGERAENGPTTLRSTTDAVISIEEDPEIEALSQQAVATPTNSTPLKLSPRQEHIHVHLEDDITLPGTVALSDTEVTYRPASSDVHTPVSAAMVTVIVTEEGRVTNGEGEEEKGSEVGETMTPESEASYGSIGSNSSTKSTDKLIKQ